MLHETQIEKVLDEYAIDDSGTIKKIKMHIEAFKHSPIYTTICGTKEKFCEFPIETETVCGSINLLYYDEKKKEWGVVDFKTGCIRDHSVQLEKYVQVLQENGFQSVRSEIVKI